MRRQKNIFTIKGMGFFWVSAIVCALVMTAAYPSVTDARTFRVNNRQDIQDANPGDGVCRAVGTERRGCTLRAAIMEANAWPGADTIILRRGTYRLTLAGVSAEQNGVIGDLDIQDKLLLVGAGKDRTIIDAMAISDRIFDVHDAGIVTMNGMTLRNGTVLGQRQQEPGLVALDDQWVCPIIEPLDKGDGGAILNRGAVMMIGSMRFEGNLAICDGGAIDSINDAVMMLSDCDFEFNTAISDGGAVENDEDSLMIINNGTFEWNNAYENGGAVSNEDSLILIRQAVMEMNAATVFGGAIWNGDSDLMLVSNSEIRYNDAEDGGGIFNNDGFLNLRNNIIEYNSPNDIVDENIPED